MSEANGNHTTSEQIWLTTDSAVPFWTAAFTAIALVGAFLWWPIAVFGAVVALVLVLKWSAMSRRETAELP